MGCLIKSIVSTLVSVGILAGVVCILLFACTPNTFGLGQADLGFGTLEELGLADKTFYTIISEITGVMAEPKESEIVTNGYDPEEEAPKATENLSNSNAVGEDGTTKYKTMFESRIEYDERYLLTYEDHTLGYMFNQMLDEVVKESQGEQAGPFAALSSFNLRMNELTIYESESSTATLKMVASLNIGSIKEEMFKGVPAILTNIIPNNFYIVSEQTVSADSHGIITTTSKDVQINGRDTEMAEIIIKAVASMMGSDGTDDKAFINDMLGQAFTVVMSNLGEVGTATAGANKVVNEATIQLGSAGIVATPTPGSPNGKISVITHKRATA